MAGEDNPEETPDAAQEAEDGDTGEEADTTAPSEEAANRVIDAEDPPTRYPAAKMAGIIVGAVLLCAVIVVAALLVIVAIVDDDPTPTGSPTEPLAPQPLPDALADGYERPPLAYDERWDWPEKDHFAKPGFATKDGTCGTSFWFGAGQGPVVVFVFGGVGPGDWGKPGDFGFGELRGGPRDLLPFMVPFFSGEGWFDSGEWPSGQGLEGFFDGLGPEALGKGFFEDPSALMEDFFGEPSLVEPPLHEELGLEVMELDNAELDNEGPEVVSGLTPT